MTPFGRFGFTFVSVVNTAPFTGFVATKGVGVMMEKRSCNPKNKPGCVLLMPGGYKLCARNPTVRAEYARFVVEKNTAVRAFCTATSQLKRVVFDDVQNVPSTVGATPLEFGLFTTEMNTSVRCPRGNRMPARVVRARLAAATMIFVTSIAESRAVLPGSGVDEVSFAMG